MVPLPVRDWGEALTTSFAQALSLFLAAIPRIVGFLIIVAIGWFLATLIAKGVAALLRTIRFNEMAQRSGFAGFVANTGVETDSFMRDCRTKGETPLHRAAAFGTEETIQLLLDAGAQVDAKDMYGDSPLGWASWYVRPRPILRKLCYGPHRVR